MLSAQHVFFLIGLQVFWCVQIEYFYGVLRELWLSRTKAFATVGGQPLLFDRNYVHVGVATAELLIARYEASGLRLSFVVAHAPHSGHQAQHIDEWWKRLQEQIGRFCMHTQCIILIDANADVQEETPFAGDLLHCNREKPRVGDRALMSLLRQHSLWAPASFSTQHHGQTSTWTANDATKTARSDFVLLPLEWWGFDIKSSNVHELDSGVGGLDHIAVGVTVRGWFQITINEKKKWKWDRHKIPKATEETWNAFFADWPSIPWHLDTTSHAAVLERHLQQRLQAFFPHDTHRRRSNTQLSDDTWNLFTQRNRLKKVLHAHHKAWQQLSLQIAFDAIVDGEGWCPLDVRFLCYGVKMAATWKRHKDTQDDIKRSSRHDRARYVAAQMEEVAQQDHKQVLRLLKPMRIGRRVQQLGRKPLPMIRLEDGSTAENFQSAQDRWRRHFARMEGGTISTASQLLQDQRQQRPGGEVEADQLPTIFELERQMMKAKAKKAMGPDGVPPEILKHAAAHMSYHYWPLFAKISLTRQESLQFKGGKLVAAYKQRGATTDCGSYRALLVSSSLAKSFHSVYRKRSLRYVQQGAGQLQFTSHQSPSVGLAAHIVRLHQQAAQRHGRSSITLFLDIKEAFYCVIRQHSMPATFEDQDVFRFLHIFASDGCKGFAYPASCITSRRRADLGGFGMWRAPPRDHHRVPSWNMVPSSYGRARAAHQNGERNPTRRWVRRRFVGVDFCKVASKTWRQTGKWRSTVASRMEQRREPPYSKRRQWHQERYHSLGRRCCSSGRFSWPPRGCGQAHIYHRDARTWPTSIWDDAELRTGENRSGSGYQRERMSHCEEKAIQWEQRTHRHQHGPWRQTPTTSCTEVQTFGRVHCSRGEDWTRDPTSNCSRTTSMRRLPHQDLWQQCHSADTPATSTEKHCHHISDVQCGMLATSQPKGHQVVDARYALVISHCPPENHAPLGSSTSTRQWSSRPLPSSTSHDGAPHPQVATLRAIY